MNDEKQKLADGSIKEEVFDSVLREERARLNAEIQSERVKLNQRERRMNDAIKEEVVEKILGKERRALDRERERLAEERRKVADAQDALVILSAKEAAVLELSELIGRQIEVAYYEMPKEKTQGFPWLARAYQDLLQTHDRLLAEILEVKDSPAPRAAETVRKVSRLRREAERKAKVLEYQLRYYEALFPWLSELTGEGVGDLLIAIGAEDSSSEDEAAGADPARHWLTEAEFQSLSTAERSQLALDRYCNRKKPPWEIGRDYERYVGYQYENDGYAVHYQGIVEGLEDLGRDLIARKGDRAVVIQCKCWSSTKVIHEKHINQLFGTVTAFAIDHPDVSTSGVFCTSTTLSERAKEFADKLGIVVVEQAPLKDYPRIKCNISRRSGERIYHLPFDQQYDRTVIEEGGLECYVSTVAEAEELGFRRAFRWRGPESSAAASPP